MIDTEWKPEGWSQQPTAVITLNIQGKDYIIDLLTYNENIQNGKTKFITIKDQVHMVSEEDYKAIEQGIKNFRKL